MPDPIIVPNMRVLGNNYATGATASSTAGTLVASNMLNDLKSVVWRAGGTSATLSLFWSGSRFVNCVVLALNNFTAGATMRVTGSGIDSGSVACVAATMPTPNDWGAAPLGANAFNYGGGNYAVVYFTGANVSGVNIDIFDSGNPAGYIEVARAMVGEYFEPKYNADFGAQIGMTDSTTNQRSDAGDLISDRGYRNRTLKFNLGFMAPVDRTKLMAVLRGAGKSSPVFVSIFPLNVDKELERDHQIVGRLTDTSGIAVSNINAYNGGLELEEI